MIAMSKEMMIQYLKDYANLSYMVMNNPQVNIGRLFDKYMIENGRYEDDTLEYYDRMRRVYSSYLYFKLFSFTEDFLLNKDDFLSNNDLNGLEQGCTFYTDVKGITNKKIVQLIRDAFCHNDVPDFDRFRISVNGKYFEVEFKDVRTKNEKNNNFPIKPFKIKFDLDYLIKINKIICNKRQNLLFLSFNIPEDFNIFSDTLDSELDKITFIHYYFTKKLSRETIEELKKLSDVKGLTNDEILERSNKMHSFAQNLNLPLEYSLTEEQKNKIKAEIERYKKFYPELLDNDINAVMYYFLRKVIPVPGLKESIIDNQILISDGYFLDVDLSLNEMLKRVVCVINETDRPETYDDIDNFIHDTIASKTKSSQMALYKDFLDGEFISGIPIIMYIDAVVTHYCTDEEISIDGINYSKTKIRNSFAHGRWYISDNKEIIMFDAEPRNINDYNLEFIGKIDIGSFEKWADQYMNQKNKKFGR